MPRLGSQVCCQKINEQIQNIKEKECDIKKALRRCSKDKAATCRRRRHLEKVALNVLCQSGENKMLTQEYLERNLSWQSAATVTDTFVAVLAAFDWLTAEEITALREYTETEKSTPLARTAARFLKECRLAKWVETRNLEQSIAPVVFPSGTRSQSLQVFTARTDKHKA